MDIKSKRLLCLSRNKTNSECLQGLLRSPCSKHTYRLQNFPFFYYPLFSLRILNSKLIDLTSNIYIIRGKIITKNMMFANP